MDIETKIDRENLLLKNEEILENKGGRHRLNPEEGISTCSNGRESLDFLSLDPLQKEQRLQNQLHKLCFQRY
jgi:hypothetical protein